MMNRLGLLRGALLGWGLMGVMGCSSPALAPLPSRAPAPTTDVADAEADGAGQTKVIVERTSNGAPRAAPAAPKPKPKPVTLVTPKRKPACAQAQALQKRAEQLIAGGWMQRSERLLDRADKLCGEVIVKSATLRTKLHKAAAATGTGAELWKRSEAARAKGDKAQARQLASLAVQRLQIEQGVQAKVIDVSTGLSPQLLSADGKWQVASSKHGILLLKDQLSPYRLFPGKGGHVVLSEDGKRLAVASANNTITIWDVEAGKRLNKVSWADETPSWFGFTAQGKQLLMANLAFSGGGQLHLFDVATGDAVKHAVVPAAARSFRGDVATASVAGDWVAFHTGKATLTLVDTKTLKTLRTLPGPSPLKDRRSGMKRLVPSPSGKRIAALMESGRLLVWDTATGKLLLNRTGLSSWFGGTIGFTKSEQRVVAPSGSFGRTMLEIEISTGTERRTYASGGDRAVLAVGTPLMLGGSRSGAGLSLRKLDRTGSVVVRRGRGASRIEGMATGAGQLALAHEVRSGRDSQILLGWWSGAERSQGTFLQSGYKAQLAFSADGRQLIAATGHGRVALWSLPGATMTELPKIDGWVQSLALGLDGTARVVGGPFNTKLLSLPTGASSWTKDLQLKGRDHGAKFSADGRTAALFERRDARSVDLRSQPPAVTSMPQLDKGDSWHALSGDGQWLFAESGGALVRFEAGEPKAPPIVVKKNCDVRALSVSYDGSTAIVSCGYRNTNIIVAGQSRQVPLKGEGHQLVRDGSAWLSYKSGVAYAGRTDKPQDYVSIELDPASRTSMLLSTRGTYELSGQEPQAFSKHLACQLGQRLFPLQLCEDIRYEDDLILRILAPEP